MGTNFYTEPLKEDYDEGLDMKFFTDNYEAHIGKRSAAGLYCWDCEVTLCKGGNQHIHSSDRNWYICCPKCGQKKEDEEISESSAGLELGFRSKDYEPKFKGVRSISSFTWAVDPAKFVNDASIETVFDEYGREYTKEDFRDKILKECPVQYFEMIGTEFS